MLSNSLLKLEIKIQEWMKAMRRERERDAANAQIMHEMPQRECDTSK